MKTTILLFILIIALLAIRIWYLLTHPTERKELEGNTFTVRIPFDTPYDSQTLNTFVDESNPYHEINKAILRDLLNREVQE